MLLGAGHAHVEVLRSFVMNPVDELDLVLVNPSSEAYYSGMLPGVVAGQYERREAVIDAASLATRAGAEFVRDEAVHIDAAARRVHFRHHPPLSFDWLSVDIGSRTRRPPAARASPRVLAPRPFPEFLDGLSRWDREMRDGESITVIGGGAAGFELSCALRARFPHANILLMDGGTMPSDLKSSLDQRRIGFESGRVERLSGESTIRIECENGKVHTSDYVVTAMGAEAPSLLESLDLPKRDGFLVVNECLQTEGHPIFAAGDCAAVPFPWVKKAGVFAVREGPILAHNLRAALSGETLARFHPQKRFLRLLNLCDGTAIAEWGPFRAKGAWAWKWKDQIDRAFLEKYAGTATPMEEPECGGCGGKVSADLLREALDALPSTPGSEVEWGVAAAEDVAIQRLGGARLAATVDEFRNFGVDPWTYGRIAAVSAASDLYAKGIAPRSALLSVTLPKYAPELAVDWLKQLLAGARSVLEPEGVEVLGGQTSEGGEWKLGLSLFGLVEREPWPKRGARPGDALVLTKPLGTGVLLAAAMQGAPLGSALDHTLASMEQSQRAAREVLEKNAPHASTDVTGFSLIGHLSEMLGSELGAELRFTEIPFLPGARECYARGFRSRMHVLNARSFRADLGSSEDTAILYDPQTSGGLLLAVSEERASGLVEKLRAAGYAHAARIGVVTDSGGIRVR